MKNKSNKITIPEASEILGISKATVTYWARTGHFKTEREKDRWVIDKKSLQKFKNSRFGGNLGANFLYIGGPTNKTRKTYAKRNLGLKKPIFPTLRE